MATCTPVTSVVSTPKSACNGDLEGHEIKMPDSLQSLYERSVTNLSEDQSPCCVTFLAGMLMSFPVHLEI